MSGHRFMAEEPTRFSTVWSNDSKPTGNLSASYWKQFSIFLRKRQSSKNGHVSDNKANRPSVLKNNGQNELKDTREVVKPTNLSNAPPDSVPPVHNPVASAWVKTSDNPVASAWVKTSDNPVASAWVKTSDNPVASAWVKTSDPRLTGRVYSTAEPSLMTGKELVDGRTGKLVNE